MKSAKWSEDVVEKSNLMKIENWKVRIGNWELKMKKMGVEWKKVGVGDVDLGARFVFLLNYAKAVQKCI